MEAVCSLAGAEPSGGRNHQSPTESATGVESPSHNCPKNKETASPASSQESQGAGPHLALSFGCKGNGRCSSLLVMSYLQHSGGAGHHITSSLGSSLSDQPSRLELVAPAVEGNPPPAMHESSEGHLRSQAQTSPAPVLTNQGNFWGDAGVRGRTGPGNTVPAEALRTWLLSQEPAAGWARRVAWPDPAIWDQREEHPVPSEDTARASSSSALKGHSAKGRLRGRSEWGEDENSVNKET